MITDRILRAKTVRDYVCSVCWGPLMDVMVEGVPDVVCANYHTEHAGFVTKRYADRRKTDSLGDAYDVRHLLQKAGVMQNPHAGKTAKQILDELGF